MMNIELQDVEESHICKKNKKSIYRKYRSSDQIFIRNKNDFYSSGKWFFLERFRD